MITAILMHVGKETLSKFGGTYFIMKFKDIDTGKYYDLEPSSNINEYETWKQLARDHLGSIFEGLMVQDKTHLVKRKLPEKVTVPYSNQQALI